MQSRADMNVRTLRGSHMEEGSLDGVVCSDRVDLNNRPETVLRQLGNRRQEVPSGTYVHVLQL